MSYVDSLQSTAGRITPFACTCHGEGRGAAWISASGELDLASVSELEQTVQDALAGALLVIIDLQQLTFIDSAGIHLLLDADADARETGHRIVVIHGAGLVGRLFALLGLADRLKVVELTPRLAYAEDQVGEASAWTCEGHDVAIGA